MVRLSIALFILIGVVQAFGQGRDCEQTLNQASAEFDAGRFYGIEGILKPCLESGFSNEQKVRAYLLLTQAHLILNEPEAAENSYLQLLKANPEYVASPAHDPIDVYYLSKKFTTTPVFTPNFRIGANASLPRNIFSANTSSAQHQLSSEHFFKVGYQFILGLDWNLDENWSICIGPGYSKKTFKTVYTDNNESTKRNFTEKQDWIDIPLIVRYSKDSGTFRPYAYAGVAANLLVGAKLSAEEIFFNSSVSGTQAVSQGPDVPIKYKRNFFNRSLVAGIGFKYKVGKNFFLVDVRYMAGLSNLAKNPYSNSSGQFDKLTSTYEYSSDFFRLDNLSLSIGYVKPLYNPRKKKPAVTGLLQKLGITRRRK